MILPLWYAKRRLCFLTYRSHQRLQGNDNSWLLLDVPSITEEKVGAIDALSLSIAPSAPKQCANSNDVRANRRILLSAYLYQRTLQTTTDGPTTKSRGTCVINGLIVLVDGETVCPAQPACAQNYGGGDCTTYDPIRAWTPRGVHIVPYFAWHRPLCTSSCSGRGTCIGVSPATPYCQCATGWQGVRLCRALLVSDKFACRAHAR